ncbi:hypothetical protein K502DRAFT_364108 [Neoconidiobolus thromboides FSU 785]|nr:hypothetical protein K502DRAFT_364108 [Neoconidiobolus thromboides FSU 785]
MLSKWFIWFADTDSPIAIVLTGSMEPGINRGDLLFLSPIEDSVQIGDIILFHLKSVNNPIIHRVITLHRDNSITKEFILTKGDNNLSNDRELYNNDQLWLERKDITGIVKGYIPYIGIIILFLTEGYRIYIGIFSLLLLLLFSKD